MICIMHVVTFGRVLLPNKNVCKSITENKTAGQEVSMFEFRVIRVFEFN